MNIIKSAKNANETFGETVNSAAAQTADSLGRAVDSARDRIDGVVNTVAASAAEVAQQAPAAAERVQAFAKNSLDAGRDAALRVRQRVSRGADACSQYVTEQPGKSVAIAAAAGATIAAVIMLARQRSRAAARN